MTLGKSASLAYEKECIHLAAFSDPIDIIDPLYGLLEKRKKIARTIMNTYETDERTSVELRAVFELINADIMRVIGIQK